MRIIFISAMDYGVAGAAQARQLSVMSYLGKQGFDVQLLNLQVANRSNNEIKTRYLPRVCRFIPWRLSLTIFLLPLLISICWRKSNSKLLLCCYDRDPFILGSAVLIKKVFRLPLIHEITEYPSVTAQKGLYGAGSQLLFERLLLRSLNGVIVISRSLIEYVGTFSKSTSTILIPSIVDFSRFPRTSKLRADAFTFVYAGSLSEKKDGVISMIKAFALAQTAIPEVSLRLDIYGMGSKSEMTSLATEIELHCLQDQVALKGGVSPAHISAVMQDADALIHCRPFSKQAKGGFPTKLAEYLASGRPVLTTITSDIARYLQDGENAYLSPPNDPEYFSRKMVEIVTEPEKGEKIGEKGREVAKCFFDAEKNSIILGEWIESTVRKLQP